MPTGAVYRRMLRQLHPAEDNINKVIIGISPWPMYVVELGEVADASAHRSELGQVANREQTTKPMESKEVRRRRNHNQWKRGIAAGQVRVVDYISSRILTKVSYSLALPSPDNSFVCANFSAPHKYHRLE